MRENKHLFWDDQFNNKKIRRSPFGLDPMRRLGSLSWTVDTCFSASNLKEESLSMLLLSSSDPSTAIAPATSSEIPTSVSTSMRGGPQEKSLCPRD